MRTHERTDRHEEANSHFFAIFQTRVKTAVGTLQQTATHNT